MTEKIEQPLDTAAVARLIDHTLLKPAAACDEIEALCAEARNYHFASVCVNLAYVALCAELLGDVDDVAVCTVIGFPLGAVLPVAQQHNVLCKVILETALLTDAEKETACQIAKAAGADFVKTSTGFGPGGATVEDIALMRRVVGPEMGVKASGGVRTFADVQAMVAAGATRIGASAGVRIVEEALGKATDPAEPDNY